MLVTLRPAFKHDRTRSSALEGTTMRKNQETAALTEQEHFTPATREAIHTAQREAVRMNAVEVMPEHLFLGGPCPER